MRNFKNKPLITIITVVLNNKKKLDKALKSILRQLLRRLPKASTASTLAAIHEFKGQRLSQSRVHSD
jgi:glycosyltransferase involved in cell wall biosynthesis